MRSRVILILLVSFSLMLCASSQKQIQKSRENDPQYQYNLGAVHLRNNEVDAAIKCFDKSLSLDPRYFVALNARGLAYSMKGNLEEASRSFQKCLEVSPQFSEARNNLGMVYQEKGFLDQASDEFNKAMRDQNYSSRDLPALNLAKLYLAENKIDEALEMAQKSVQFNPRNAIAQSVAGYLFEKKDRLSDAISSYEKAVKIVPDDVNFNYYLGAAYFKAQDYKKAEEALQRISSKALDPDMKKEVENYLKMIKEKTK